MTKKAVILARGLGTRMQKAQDGVELDVERAALARKGLKVLMSLHGRPMVDYAVDRLVRAGVDRICLVIAPEADQMRAHADRLSRQAGIRVGWAVQDEPRGTADAVLAAEAFAGDDPFVVCNGDNLYPPDTMARLVALDGDECCVAAFEREALHRKGNIAPERLRSMAVVQATPDGRLLRIVEKPPDPERYAVDGQVWANMNLYRFTPAVFDACRSIEPHPERKEYELTAAVERLRAAAPQAFRVLFSDGGVLDLTSRGDIAAVEHALAQERLSF
ncbi:MAG: nucleotidyltransferase family protein [Candidatus Brocadiaceae bacterium]|nr:nucleotidyltransferase family protein [Candidatus Brocadiaceae bacterium]